MTTSISWTDETWNWLVGCSKISSGCANCYAAEAAKSVRLQQFPQYQKVKKWDGTVEFVESQLLKPLSWRSPKKIFTCSMSDVFHESVKFEWIDKAFAIMALCPQHTFQILTKRPERMLEYFNYRNDLAPDWIEIPGRKQAVNLTRSLPLPNVWLGVSVENQKAADERIPLLLQTSASIRFLSCEPLLEPLDLSEWMSESSEYSPQISWVIIGGESGSKARECHTGWIRSLIHQCQLVSIPIFVKQLGSYSIATNPYIQGVAYTHYQIKFNDRKASDISEWPEDLKIRQFPN